jgi:hypothetical protein
MNHAFAAPSLTSAEELLIVAALGDRDAVRAAWNEWQQANSLDDVEPAAFAVLPAVSRNLDRLEIEHEDAAKLRGIYRYAWSHGQTTFRDLAQVHQALAGAGVRALAHRGGPVALHYLGDVAAIRTDQVDLLIAADDLDRTAHVIAGLGWSSLGAVPPGVIRSAFAAHVFECAGRRRVVVHWRSFPAGVPKGEETALLERAMPMSFQGVDLLLPDPADQLLLACARAHTLAEVERVRWALETCAVLRTAASTLDHRAFEERARRAGLLSECGSVLGALDILARTHALTFPVLRLPTPGEAGTHWGRAGMARATGLQRILRAARAGLDRYSAVCRSDGVARTPWGFVGFTAAFYRHEWGANGLRGLAVAGARRIRDGGDQPLVRKAL